jgi:hypothetical protein
MEANFPALAGDWRRTAMLPAFMPEASTGSKAFKAGKGVTSAKAKVQDEESSRLSKRL